MAENRVSVLITCDIDPTPEASLGEKRGALQRTLELFDKYNIKSTFFYVASVAKDYTNQIEAQLAGGHEIGCHGLNHDEYEEYNRLEGSVQRDLLTRATAILRELSGKEIKSFRGPRVKTSNITHGILESLGYSADSSVCSQRIDFVSSNLINLKWITAPRLPYNPSISSAFKRGKRRIVVVPVSAIVVPFLSGALYTFGLGFMKTFFRLLYIESKKSGKPVVYILHPAEFARRTERRKERYSLRVEGFRFRRSEFFFEQDEERRYELNDRLMEFISSYPDVEFITVNDFVLKFKGES